MIIFGAEGQGVRVVLEHRQSRRGLPDRSWACHKGTGPLATQSGKEVVGRMNKCPNLNCQWCLLFLELDQKPEGKGAFGVMSKDQSLGPPARWRRVRVHLGRERDYLIYFDMNAMLIIASAPKYEHYL